MEFDLLMNERKAGGPALFVDCLSPPPLLLWVRGGCGRTAPQKRENAEREKGMKTNEAEELVCE